MVLSVIALALTEKERDLRRGLNEVCWEKACRKKGELEEASEEDLIRVGGKEEEVVLCWRGVKKVVEKAMEAMFVWLRREETERRELFLKWIFCERDKLEVNIEFG
jgi:hypothetical protein